MCVQDGTIEVLLVEDNPADVRLAKEALKKGRLLSRVNVVGDGVEAQAYLRRKGQYADAMQPDLILFDLNLPKKNGRELVPEINVGPTLRRIRLIVLTTLSAEDDILRTYDLHANCDLTKPVDPG